MPVAIADSLRLTLASSRRRYGDHPPAVDTQMYEGRSYTLAAASCFAAAYAAAEVHRDNTAVQFYRLALVLADALCPEPLRDVNEDGKEIERSVEEKAVIMSKYQASQMSIASNYGILAVLNNSNKSHTAIHIYKDAHDHCVAAHKEASQLRHSPFDMSFAETVATAATATGVIYNQELAVWTTAVKAAMENKVPTLTPDVYVAETPEQRRKHSIQATDAMLRSLQQKAAAVKKQRDDNLAKLLAKNAEILSQAEVADVATKKYEEITEQHTACRKKMETERGKFSELSVERRKLRVTQTTYDAQFYQLNECIQTIVNLRAQDQTA